jgi:two-component system, OmpR family, sensor kinase
VRSIRARLLIGLLASVLAVQVVMYTMIYARIEDEIDDLFDAELERSALATGQTLPQPFIPTPSRRVEDPQEEMVVSVFRGTDSEPSYQTHPLNGIPHSAPTGFSKLRLGGRDWRLFGSRVGDRFVVAAQPGDVRNRAARRITLRSLMPSAVSLPLAALMIWLAVAYGLRPLVRIAHDLRRRSHRDLTALDLKRLPPDIAPLAQALNELMGRLAAIISKQRTFIADAAHELLTPLTALQLQAQMLARAKSPSRQSEAMQELQGGVSRTLQLARQLLTLARQDADGELADKGEVDLAAVLKGVLSIHLPLAANKALQTNIGIEERAIVFGNEEALSILVSNLIDNSIKYTDREGSLLIRLKSAQAGAELRIEDSGPGIPAEDRERVFDRFYRRGDTTVTGNGLGLAIAKEIADRHGASIVLEGSETLGGLSARVLFQTARAAA